MKLLDTCLVFQEDFFFASGELQMELWRIVVVSFGFVLPPCFQKTAPMRMEQRPWSTIC